MIKQRFVVYKAFDKSGEAVVDLLVAGGRNMPFSSLDATFELTYTTKELMCYGTFESVDHWRKYAKRCGACRFQKVIYFN